MHGTNAALLKRDILPVLHQTSVQDSAVMKEASLQTIEATASTEASNGQESYELGTTLKNVGLFRQAVSSTSSKEQVQILYLLGRTLESLERIPEALEAYRWLRREAPQYRDVAIRIESLSMGRMHRDNVTNGKGRLPQVTRHWNRGRVF